jgi:hypothetical protein
MGLFRKSETDKRLPPAKADLTAQRAKLTAIDAGEAAALGDAAAYAKWREGRAAVVAEVERLERLIAALEAGAEAARVHDEAEATRRRLAAARKAADDLAMRIKIDGQRIATELLQLMREAAQQSLQAKMLNAELPEGEAPVPTADILARDFGATPREDIRSREVDLWVMAGTGAVVGDQRAVISADGITGHFNAAGGSMRPRCLKRRFRETEYRPAETPDWPGNLFALVKLPHFTGPGPLFDGSILTIEQVAALDVDAAAKPAKKPKRPVQVELAPIDPTWPPAGIAPGEAGRNAA